VANWWTTTLLYVRLSRLNDNRYGNGDDDNKYEAGERSSSVHLCTQRLPPTARSSFSFEHPHSRPLFPHVSRTCWHRLVRRVAMVCAHH
jgi:hypothetical protein